MDWPEEKGGFDRTSIFFASDKKKLLADPFSPSGAFSALLHTFFTPEFTLTFFSLAYVFFLRRAHQGITTCFGRGSGDRREGEI